jgi:hypothetical protein
MIGSSLKGQQVLVKLSLNEAEDSGLRSLHFLIEMSYKSQLRFKCSRHRY